jgi:diguanylate cyclase (GGDEF)-like protein
MAGTTRMIESPKIAIVYRDEAPQFLLETPSQGIPWTVESFSETTILSGPLTPLRGYLAVFFPVDDDIPEIQPHLSNFFPGAEIVGYRNSNKSQTGGLINRKEDLLVLQFPMPLGMVRHLLEDFTKARAHQRELVAVQRRANNLEDFFAAFAHTVESSSSLSDRKLGMSMLINKILFHVRAEECILYLFGEGGEALQRSYSTGNIKAIDLFEQHANSSIVERVLNNGTPYINNHYSFELQVPFGRESVFIHSILCYPLVHKGKTIGVIELLNKTTGFFTREDQALIEMMLNPLAVAIRTVEIFESSERLTITDDLTKLYNYRYLMTYLEADVKRCLRYKKKVSLLFIDVDGFKRINDTFGHLVGSQALAEMGQVFRRIVRETDVVGRYGGDEFVIVLPETPLSGAMVIAERIRRKVEECEFVAQNLSIRLTVSLGVANCPKHTLTAEGLIKKADAAMYRAKELSKNSIKVAV